MLEAPANHRCGYVALVGKPNAGKSTLLNALVGQKLSIVTRKPQTTRGRVLGVVSDDDHQVILLDTPGVIRPRYRLQESMMKDVASSVRDADLVLFLADVTHSGTDDLGLATLFDQPAILVLNKMDLIRPEEALPIVTAYQEQRSFEEVVPISALKGRNLDTLWRLVVDRLPLGPPFYPKDQLSEHPERFFVAEIVREKIFERYRQEVPYACQVNIVSFEEREDDKDLIDAEIVVERQSQKGIMIGKGGKALKAVGTAARRDIEEFLGRDVFLRLFVKVRADWRNSPAHLRSYGFDA